MWRSGSTYIWNQFRKQPNYRAYFEPLHELLFRTTEGELRAILPAKTASTARHPSVKDYYFSEYPFEPEGGVRYFEKYFSYAKYCLEADASDAPFRRYLLSLIELAWRNQQRPMFKFNRALMRAGWLKANFPSYGILLLRNPRDIWRSFLSFENPYFVVVICMIVGQNRSDPVLGEIARRHEVPYYLAETFDEECRFYHSYVSQHLTQLYPVFFDFYMLTSVASARHVDCVIDINQVSTSAQSRDFIARRLQERGIVLPLSDCNIVRYPNPSDVTEMQAEYELKARRDLQSSLASQLSIPEAKLEEFSPGLSPYSLELLVDWSF